MIASTLALAAVLTQEADWQSVRVGNSGLRIELPIKPEIVTTAEEIQLTATHKSVTVSIVARPTTADQALDPSKGYVEAFGTFRERYGKKIKTIINEDEVVEAAMFGAPASMGFVIEVDDEGGKAHAWQQIFIDDFEYTINIETARRDQPILIKILQSAQYVNPETGDFRVAPLGNTGLQSYLGIAFLPQDDIERKDAKSVVLQASQFPAFILASVWQNETVDYEDPADLKKAMIKWLTEFVQGAQAELTLTPTKVEGQTLYTISGEVIVQGVQINLLGRAFARRDDAQVVIAVIDPKVEKAEPFARKILESVTQINN